jgi:hypothetical protein
MEYWFSYCLTSTPVLHYSITPVFLLCLTSAFLILGICIFPLRTLRLCGEKQVFNLDILGDGVHFRDCFLNSDSCLLENREVSLIFPRHGICSLWLIRVQNEAEGEAV